MYFTSKLKLGSIHHMHIKYAITFCHLLLNNTFGTKLLYLKKIKMYVF